MNIVSFGGGTNSAALLIGLYKHKIPIDLITFADTGAEHPHTYQFIEIINQWLAEHGMPQITVVQYVDRYGNRLSLETECLRSHTLPSIAYGHKRCSQKHKIAPQEKFCNHYAPCREVWQRGEKVNRYIGYDAGEVKRYEHSRKYNEADKKYHNRYPLIEEWGWNRDDCIREIKAAGLPQPGKSSCFFCPSMKKQEILYLKEHYPDLFNRAATLEENAMPYLKTVKGLGRSYSWKEKFERGKKKWGKRNLTVSKGILRKRGQKSLNTKKKLKDLEAQKIEEENAQIVQMVKAVHLDGDAACRVPLRLRQRRNHLAAAGRRLYPDEQEETDNEA